MLVLNLGQHGQRMLQKFRAVWPIQYTLDGPQRAIQFTPMDRIEYLSRAFRPSQAGSIQPMRFCSTRYIVRSAPRRHPRRPARDRVLPGNQRDPPRLHAPTRECVVVSDLFEGSTVSAENETERVRSYLDLTRKSFERHYLKFHRDLPEIYVGPSQGLSADSLG